jgi:hypothetical protein
MLPTISVKIHINDAAEPPFIQFLGIQNGNKHYSLCLRWKLQPFLRKSCLESFAFGVKS